jgi:hypothetical protein
MDHGLAPVDINPEATASTIFSSHHVSMGALGDSFYEYMLKQYLLGGKKDRKLLEMYTAAMQGVRDVLLAETAPGISSRCPMGEPQCCRQPVSDLSLS